MKNTRTVQRAIGVFAVIAFIGFALSSCGGNGNGSPAGLPGPVVTPGLYAGQFVSLNAASVPIAGVDANDLQAVLDHVNANAADGYFTWFLGENIAVDGSTTRGLNQTDARLTIIGLGQERTISLTSAGLILIVGATGQTGISLTLGNNVALVGLATPATNSHGLVRVDQSAAFTMLAGSEIRGNTSSGNTAAGNWGAALHVQNDGNFTMLGGSITGNHSTADTATARGGGLYANANAVIMLAGGSITGNTAVWGGDIFLLDNVASLTLSGTAAVGTVVLNAIGAAAASRISLTVADGWTGTVAGLNLRGSNANTATVINFWNANAPLTGPGVNAANVARITLGNFVTNDASEAGRQPIAPTHHINAEGVLVVN